MTTAPFSFRARLPEAWAFHQRSSNVPHAVGDPGPAPTRWFKEYLSAPLIALPPARPPGARLHAALRARASCRRFSPAPLPLARLSSLLKYGYGVFDRFAVDEVEFLWRPVASAGGLYPLEIYLMVRNVEGLAQGVYHYAPLPHALELVRQTPIARSFDSACFVGQNGLTDAACVLVVSAMLERTCFKYGARGYRYLMMEVGQAAQALALVAAATRIGCLNVGGFFEQPLGRFLELDPDQELPLLCVALGRPVSGDPVHRRNLGLAAR